MYVCMYFIHKPFGTVWNLEISDFMNGNVTYSNILAVLLLLTV